MDISLTERELRLLLDLVYMGEWVADSHRVGQDPRIQPYKEVVQKIYRLVNEAGMEELVEHAPELGGYFTTRAMEETEPLPSLIAEYDDETFWSELAMRLAERDAADLVGGVGRLSQLPKDRRMTLVLERENDYLEEFSRHGLDNLYLSRPTPPSRGRPRPS